MRTSIARTGFVGTVAERGLVGRLDYEHVAPAAIRTGGRLPAAQSMALWDGFAQRPEDA